MRFYFGENPVGRRPDFLYGIGGLGLSDVRLFFEEAGEGFPLVLLHGNGEDSSYFAHQVSAFSGHFRVIAVDTRGHGRSPRGGAPFTLEQFALDLRDFLDERGIARAHLLGFSDGANIALMFALRFPDRVGRLILDGGNLFPGGVKRSVQRPIEFAYWLTKPFSRFSRRARAKHELLALMVEQPNLTPGQLGALTMPVLVMAGTDDMILDEHTRLIHRSIPGSGLRLIPGGHFIARENPEPFNRAVLEFLFSEEES